MFSNVLARLTHAVAVGALGGGPFAAMAAPARCAALRKHSWRALSGSTTGLQTMGLIVGDHDTIALRTSIVTRWDGGGGENHVFIGWRTGEGVL